MLLLALMRGGSKPQTTNQFAVPVSTAQPPQEESQRRVCLRHDCPHNTLKLLSGSNWTDVTEICMNNPAVSSTEQSLRSQVHLKIKYRFTNSCAYLVRYSHIAITLQSSFAFKIALPTRFLRRYLSFISHFEQHPVLRGVQDLLFFRWTGMRFG